MPSKPKKTDAAWELAEFVKWTRTLVHTNNNTPLYQVISEAVQVDPSHQMFYPMFGALTERTGRVGRIRQSLFDQTEITGAENNSLMIALGNISLFVSLPNLNASWSNLPNRISESDVVALMSLSQQIRDTHPLRAIRDSDLPEICGQIDAKYQEIFKDDDIDAWIKEVLCDALLKLRWSIQHVRFFGHETIFDELLVVQEKADRLSKCNSSEKGKSSLFEVVNFIAVFATAFAAPDFTYTASRHYWEFFGHHGSQQRQLPSSPESEPILKLTSLGTPLLPGPKV